MMSLHLRHHRHLLGPIGQIGTLALSARVIAIEIGGPMLELGEILDRAQGSFRSVNWLNIPLRLVESRRNRAACGRMSGV
jgi:hypothetical protein